MTVVTAIATQFGYMRPPDGPPGPKKKKKGKHKKGG